MNVVMSSFRYYPKYRNIIGSRRNELQLPVTLLPLRQGFAEAASAGSASRYVTISRLRLRSFAFARADERHNDAIAVVN